MKAHPPALLLSLAAILMCAGPPSGRGCRHEPRESAGAPKLPAPAAQGFSEETIARSVQGREITAVIFNRGDQAPFLVFAAIHGNEAEARVLGEKLAERWKDDPALVCGRHVVLIPCLNPDGAALGTRYNANGVDLNRNFPAGWERKERGGMPFTRLMPLSEPEARALYGLVESARPRAVISIHSCRECNGMNNYDGPAAEVAGTMNGLNGYAVSNEWHTETPGSFGTWAGKEKQIPVVTLELPSPLPNDADYDQNMRAVEAAILLESP